MTTYTHDISSTQIASEIPGIHILFFGAIHGNEVCGPKALDEIIQDFETHKIELKSGKVTFVPICNKMAHDEGKRYIDVNLNRVIEKHEN
ncbi:MAG: succinylglutamate desuccinylase/aspartoacylase family protein, partial [Candidatus Gracilibacteria bacterium]|nr:succinylglutamate desuccinylase/aspartoacylase family protein [Candidatus Gracilibacteria bacterium]